MYQILSVEGLQIKGLQTSFWPSWWLRCDVLFCFPDKKPDLFPPYFTYDAMSYSSFVSVRSNTSHQQHWLRFCHCSACYSLLPTCSETHLRHSSPPFEHVCWHSALPDKCIIADSWLKVPRKSISFCAAIVGMSRMMHTLLWLSNDHFCFKEGEERVLYHSPRKGDVNGKTCTGLVLLNSSWAWKLLLFSGNCFCGKYNLWKKPQIQIFMVTQQIFVYY